MSVQETVRYLPDPNFRHQTVFTQDAKITAYGALTRFANGMMEDFTIERFRQNASRGRAGFETVLDRIFNKEDNIIQGISP